jgi:hypothetical protein
MMNCLSRVNLKNWQQLNEYTNFTTYHHFSKKCQLIVGQGKGFMLTTQSLQNRNWLTLYVSYVE